MNAPALTGDRCQCAACGLYFMADDGFDFHRVGEYAKPGQLRGNRRCLSLAELAAASWAPNDQNLVSRSYTQRASPETQGAPVPTTATTLPVGVA